MKYYNNMIQKVLLMYNNRKRYYRDYVLIG